MKLYRTATANSVLEPAGFWTPDQKYARYVHPDRRLYVASVRSGANVKKYAGSPTRAILEGAIEDGVDIAVFDAWDWMTEEFVVLDPVVLANVRPLAGAP
jgi:hypothetical protein